MSRFQSDFTAICTGTTGNRTAQGRTLDILRRLVSGSVPDLDGFTPEMLARAGYLILMAATLLRLEPKGDDAALQAMIARIREIADGGNAPFYTGDRPDHCGAARSFNLSAGADLASLLRMYRLHKAA